MSDCTCLIGPIIVWSNTETTSACQACDIRLARISGRIGNYQLGLAAEEKLHYGRHD